MEEDKPTPFILLLVEYVRQFWLDSGIDDFIRKFDNEGYNVPESVFCSIGFPINAIINFAPKEADKRNKIKSVQTDIFRIILGFIRKLRHRILIHDTSYFSLPTCLDLL